MSEPAAAARARSKTVARWLPFVLVCALLTVLLLGLARRSQQLIESETTPRGVDRQHAQRNPGGRTPEAVPPDGANPESADGEAVSTGTAAETRATAPAIELTPRLLLANVAATQGGVIVVVLAAAWYFSIPADAIGLTGDPATAVLLGTAFGVLLWVGNELSTAVADAIGASYDETLREMLSPASAGGWLVVFVAVLPTIAVAEELLFRAALIGVPAAGFGVSPWPLAVVASLAFALGHGAQGRVGIAVTGVLGFGLAAGYILSGSLLLVVVAHYLVNALEFFVHEYLGVGALFGPGSG